MSDVEVMCAPWCDGDHFDGEACCTVLHEEDDLEITVQGAKDDYLAVRVEGVELEPPDDAKLLELLAVHGLTQLLATSQQVDVDRPLAQDKPHMHWCEQNHSAGASGCRREVYDEPGALNVTLLGVPGRWVKLWINGSVFTAGQVQTIHRVLAAHAGQIAAWHAANTTPAMSEEDQLGSVATLLLARVEQVAGPQARQELLAGLDAEQRTALREQETKHRKRLGFPPLPSL